ncbi:hypothetical protein [Yoonia sediminilitoris]|uniref:Uncharacterized protein n=1 Tax=Yoonia sediminilitoris TaxID=1286148 RepID=A0A2T6KMJ0_9RHOB|nr:hypothetical protein [Yoonia sediminilitoris]PUB17367.1 hypothetical protein C8N45_102379 [Yoonia sediminilitoris]RCW97662.1 hypothetical protein DFP92_102379 [Yoonia sediminilitoris]
MVCFADGTLIKIRDGLRPVEASKALRAQAKQEIEAVFGAVPYPDRPLARLTPKGKKARHLVNRHVKNAKALYSNI